MSLTHRRRLYYLGRRRIAVAGGGTGQGVIKRFAGCFSDHRNPDYIEHSVVELVGQRIYGICLGYEDLNDHDTLRVDPLLATLVGKLDPSGENHCHKKDKGKALAGKSTLNRLELTPEEKNRYQKIVHQPEKIENIFIEFFLDAHTTVRLNFRGRLKCPQMGMSPLAVLRVQLKSRDSEHSEE